MKTTFTIIIPLYNTEQYIKNTLLSIINADYDKSLIQVIVIDDGSKDNSATIVKNLSKKYNYIEYYKKKNGQWGSVINYAKNNNIIKNEYVSILDSDDLYSVNSFNILSNMANKKNPDVLVGSYRKFNGEKTLKKVRPYWFIFKRTLKKLNQKNTPFCLPLIFFTKKNIFLKMNDITEKMPYQDPDYLTQIMLLSKEIVFTKKIIGFYYFNREGNSISQEWTKKRFDDEYNACQKCIENNGQEIVSYRMNIKKFRTWIKKENIVFDINRKFKFSWYPFYIRWLYYLLHKIKFKKYFRLNVSSISK